MKAYIMGNYTAKAFQGFLKDPSSDRKAVVKQLTEAMGGTMHSMDIVRGSYDFVVVTDVPSFDDFAAIKLVVEASGAVECLMHVPPRPSVFWAHGDSAVCGRS